MDKILHKDFFFKGTNDPKRILKRTFRYNNSYLPLKNQLLTQGQDKSMQMTIIKDLGLRSKGTFSSTLLEGRRNTTLQKPQLTQLAPLLLPMLLMKNTMLPESLIPKAVLKRRQLNVCLQWASSFIHDFCKLFLILCSFGFQGNPPLSSQINTTES